MIPTPNTLGVFLLFLAVFLGCILWATRGVTSAHDPEDEDLQATGKSV